MKHKYHFPHIDDLFDQLQGASVFSKINLRFIYNLLTVRDSDISKSAFKTHYGHYEFIIMSFGMTNGPVSFIESINWVVQLYLYSFVIIFIDDIFVYSKNEIDHVRRLKGVHKKLWEAKLYVEFSTCEFWLESMTFLGHTVSKEVIMDYPAKVETICN